MVALKITLSHLGYYIPSDGVGYFACKYSTLKGAARCGPPGGGCSPGYYYTGSACAIVPAGYFSPNASSGVYYYCQYSMAPGASACGAVVMTLAGSSSFATWVDGTYMSGYLVPSTHLAVDTLGNVYVGQRTTMNGVRKISSIGVVTTLAGNAVTLTSPTAVTDGQGTAATFGTIYGIAVDTSLNVYVSDFGYHNVRVVSSSGLVTFVAGSRTGVSGSGDGQGTVAGFYNPLGIAVDTNGFVYVADYSTYKVRKISPSWVVSTFAGRATSSSTDGTGTSATFTHPQGLAVDIKGNVWVSDSGSFTIRMITSVAVVSTIAGRGSSNTLDGYGTTASFDFAQYFQLSVDSLSNVYIASSYVIRKMTSSGAVTTLAGSGANAYGDGVGTSATFNTVVGVAVDTLGNVYASDSNNHVIRKISQQGIVWVAVTFSFPTNRRNIGCRSCMLGGVFRCELDDLRARSRVYVQPVPQVQRVLLVQVADLPGQLGVCGRGRELSRGHVLQRGVLRAGGARWVWT